MAKFRKRPVVIEAEQWFPGKHIAGVVISPVLESTPDNPSGVYGQVTSHEGTLCCNPGDWIITDAAGDRWPLKPDIFVEIYEPIEGSR